MTAKIVYFTFVVVDFEQTFKKSKHGITQCPINLPDVDLKVFSFNDAQLGNHYRRINVFEKAHFD